MDEEDLIVAIQDHPMIGRVQGLLKSQLQTKLDLLEVKMMDKVEERKRLKKERENIGVELYGDQQQLGKLQLELETSHNKYNNVTKKRVNAEEKRDLIARELLDHIAEAESAEAKVLKYAKEESALHGTLRSVEEYLEGMKNEIALARRATYKEEDNLNVQEKAKRSQDFYVDSLNEQVKQLQEQISLYEAQIISQTEESKTANKTLLEAKKEMEDIEREKRHLMRQWQSSLVGISRFDVGMQATRDAIHAQKEEVLALRSEIEGYKKSCLEVQKKHEVHMDVKTRLEQGVLYNEDVVKVTVTEKEKLAVKFQLLKKSLEQTDKEADVLKAVAVGLRERVKELESNTRVVDNKRRDLELSIAVKKNDQTTATKAARNLAIAASKLQTEVHKKEVDQAQLENEAARIKVDVLNTRAHGEELKKLKEKAEKELAEKDRLIEKYDLEIRQRNDEIDKKAYIVDRLNKKHFALTEGQEEEECLGPLEATIHSLNKQTKATEAQNRELEKKWLSHQTELVTIVHETDEENSVVHDLVSREAILTQKRVRVDATIAECQAEVKKLNTAVKVLHKCMAKLNEMLAENNEKQEVLANDNYVLQTEFQEELKELEQDSLKMDDKIAATVTTKDKLLNDILESERRIKLWEKKIQLEKETQAALDPSVGESDVAEMTREIHRMKLREETLKREMEKAVKEMERAVMKHEAIALRHAKDNAPARRVRGKKVKPTHSNNAPTKSEMKRKIVHEQKAFKQNVKEANDLENAIRSLLDQGEQLGMQLEKHTNHFHQAEEMKLGLQTSIQNALHQKKANELLMIAKQRLIDQYEDWEVQGLGRDTYEQKEIPVEDEQAARKLLDSAEDQMHKVISVANSLKSNNQHLGTTFDRIVQQLNYATDVDREVDVPTIES